MDYNRMWDNIIVPDEIDSVIADAVDDGYKIMKMNKKINWLNAAIYVAGAAAALILFIGAGFLSPVIANAYSGIPFVGNIFSYLYELKGDGVRFAQIADSAEIYGAKEQGEKNESGIDIKLQEAFCDGYNFYLSMQIVSDTPFLKESSGKEEGFVHIISSESITTKSGEYIEIGGGDLRVQGVFTDANTFAGVARSDAALENYDLSDEFEYSLSSKHIMAYVMGQEGKAVDVRGEWENKGMIKCTKEPLKSESVSKPIIDGFTFKEIRVQPYELQAVMEIPISSSSADAFLWIEAFDENGNRLNSASNRLNRFEKNGDSNLEIWMFEKPVDAEKITFFVLDESKWLDEWKGYIYSDNPWPGEKMVEFLKENCFSYAQISTR